MGRLLARLKEVSMRLDRFTSKFQIAISDAQSLALGRDHQFIEPVHLMTALLNQQGGTVRSMLDQAGVNVNALRSALSQAIERLPRVEGIGGEVQLGKETKEIKEKIKKKISM